MVGGGFAIRAAGYVRRAVDIDLFMATDADNEARVFDALAKLPDAAVRELRPGKSRATALCAQLQQDAWPVLSARVVGGHSTIGGGSAPQSTLPSRLGALRSGTHSAAEVEALLRLGTPPVIARLHDDEVLLDLRTVSAEHDDTLLACICRALIP